MRRIFWPPSAKGLPGPDLLWARTWRSNTSGPRMTKNGCPRWQSILSADRSPSSLRPAARSQFAPRCWRPGRYPSFSPAARTRSQKGFVASLGRPGGNVTGVTCSTSELQSKRLQLLLELAPKAATVAFLLNPNSPTERAEHAGCGKRSSVRLGCRFKLHPRAPSVTSTSVFKNLVRQRVDALVVVADPFLETRRHQLVDASGDARDPGHLPMARGRRSGRPHQLGSQSLRTCIGSSRRLRGQNPERRQAGRSAGMTDRRNSN